jgi:UDP-N-acetylglucosamine--N-acetylmuramyl-(pentapeptide) pyrophosphoryl-undecaprenol N-acetylglucosamine transferase
MALVTMVTTAARGQGTVLFAGGGTGGHIYPNVAIHERLGEEAKARGDDAAPAARFLVSDRPGDSDTMRKLDLPFSTSGVKPLPPMRKPWRALGFYVAWRRAIADATALIVREDVRAVVATGGFVSGPALVAARRLGIARAMVNLDAVPGKANVHLRRECSTVFSAYATDMLPGAKVVGFPLRKVSIGVGDRASAKVRLDLDAERPVLFVTGATHGAESLIRAMMAIVAEPARAAALRQWHVFHQCGGFDPAELQAAYDTAGVRAKVVAYCDRMGDAWLAADLAVSRAGAGSVAEAWANATPSIFSPNPYHADGHQRANARPLVTAGGARIVDDLIVPAHNVAPLGDAIAELVGSDRERETMRERLVATRPPDGAREVARWIIDAVGTP